MAKPLPYGVIASLGTALTTLVTFAVALATPPISGELCRADCVRYPYHDVVGRFPRDYYWMFSALLANLFYLAFVVALAERAGQAARVVARYAVLLATMAAFAILSNYFVQLSFVPSSLVAGEYEGIAALSQYNPRGLFIAFEELGYLLMSLSFGALAVALRSHSALERLAKRLLGFGFAGGIMALGWTLGRRGLRRGYMFEIAIISIDWLVLISTGFAMAVVFYREPRDSHEARTDS